MGPDTKVHYTILVTTALALAAAVVSYLAYTPELSRAWYLALGTLFLISLVSQKLGLQISESGAYTSPVYIPYLAAIPLIGPAGTVVLACTSQCISQLLIRRKGVQKTLFNTAQMTAAAGLSALIYAALGGQSSFTNLPIESNVGPYLAAATSFFIVNHLAVSYIMSVSEYGEIREMWGQLLGKTVLFDIAISPLAYLVAYLYTLVGSIGLIFALIPVFGLRYIYGTTLELRRLNKDLLTVLIKTLEAQDPYTSGHSVRVAERAKMIAQEMSLGLKEISHIETAALLHDIGKIDNAYHDILRQQGPLTDEQVRLIREHPERGVEIIRSVRSLDTKILSYVRHHHERFDGQGYPDGLSGKSIPIGARVIMVSDTIDAMSTARPYRDAIPFAEIRAELIRCKRTQFDPDVVDAALVAGVVNAAVEVGDGLPFASARARAAQAEV